MKYLLIFFFLLSNDVFAKTFVAYVSKVRGKVTRLQSSQHKARVVQVGDKLLEDTSIVTGKRSFVKITFLDKSVLSIGPNSKVVVTEFEKKKGSVISLLKGRVRSKVEKESNKKKNKFYIRTRTAALGVRGTEFQTIYNPDNKVTNLLTFRGEVAMVKVNDTSDFSKKENIEVTRADDGQVKIVKSNSKKIFDISKKLDEALESKNKVIVKSGQYSGSLQNTKRVSSPVKINKAQLGLIYNNDEYDNISGTKTVKKVNKIDKFVRLDQAKQSAPPEGFYNKVTGEFAPKSGGLIDTNTGLYIAPSKKAYFDEVEQVYIPENVGAVNIDTGEYTPPKGFKLNAKSGFELASKKLKNKKNLLAFKDELNSSISKKLFEEKKAKYLGPRELFAKDRIAFSFGPTSKVVEISNNSLTGDRELNFDKNTSFELLWGLAGNGDFRPSFQFDYTKVDSKQVNDFKRDNESLFSMGFLIDYYLSEKSFFNTSLFIEEEFVPIYESSSITSMEKVAFTKISLGYVRSLYLRERMSFDASLTAIVQLEKEASSGTVDMGYGYKVGADINYWISSKTRLTLSLFSQSLFTSISGDNFSSDFRFQNNGLSISTLYAF